jgi:hypothetical protein
LYQDIFECRTCGLTGSLCCCTECARVCHRGHDCKLKRTSPTAYCDCWEKCRCKALVQGHQASRSQLLNRLINETDLVTHYNSRYYYKMLPNYSYLTFFNFSEEKVYYCFWYKQLADNQMNNVNIADHRDNELLLVKHHLLILVIFQPNCCIIKEIFLMFLLL